MLLFDRRPRRELLSSSSEDEKFVGTLFCCVLILDGIVHLLQSIKLSRRLKHNKALSYGLSAMVIATCGISITPSTIVPVYESLINFLNVKKINL